MIAMFYTRLMSSDDQGKDVKAMIASEVKGLAIEVYKDAAKPAVTHLGQTVGQAVEVALAIPNMLLTGAKAGLDKLAAALRKKLSGVPADRLLLPAAAIAAPAALHYLLLGDGDEVAELRGMFENLLAASMDRDTATRAHPAFVSMIQQLTPTEARMLVSLTRELRAPIIEVRFPSIGTHPALKPGSYQTAGFLCDFGRHLDQEPSRQTTSLSNLERLGIVDITFTAAINDVSGKIYGPLLERMRSEFGEPPPGAGPAVAHKGIVQFSAIGYDFWTTCVRVRQ